MAIVTTITAIIGLAAKGGWFTQAEFADEILGDWGDRDEDTGGLVLQLENQTGEFFPELRDMRYEAVHDFYRFRNALPWNKGSTAKEYQESVQTLAKAIQAEAEEYEGKGIFGGLLDFGLGVNIKTLLFAAVSIIIVLLVLSFVLRPKRRSK